MELAKDLMATLRNRVNPASSAGHDAGIDWVALHARLVAAHAARGELARNDSRALLRDGAFTDWALVGARGSNPFRGVNPANSTDGKGPQGIEGAVAGHLQFNGQEQ